MILLFTVNFQLTEWNTSKMQNLTPHSRTSGNNKRKTKLKFILPVHIVGAFDQLHKDSTTKCIYN